MTGDTESQRGTLMQGLVAGFLGTLSMTGFAQLVRRTVDPTGGGDGKSHYEQVGERLHALAFGPDAELTDAQRTRLGLALHYGFGGVMGAVYVKVADHLPGPPPLSGSTYAMALWLGAFGGYFPALGIGPGVWHWPASEITRTFGSHLTYGNTTMLIARALEGR